MVVALVVAANAVLVLDQRRTHQHKVRERQYRTAHKIAGAWARLVYC